MDPHAQAAMSCDVAIIGGGPAGSTAGTLLKKYRPDLRVAIFEREQFPREHVGESQLPAISYYLDEMGCWEKVEAANFPVKIGATYCWGSSEELWDFEFVPLAEVRNLQRPGSFTGPRLRTAFQVDRAVYDDILLQHAAAMGCEVRQRTKVVRVPRDGDRVLGLILEDGTTVEARYYLDASGHVGILRRAMGIESQVPTSLMNIAMWDYWEDAEWAVTVGAGGTRVQVLSLPHGWVWFIPVGPTRTSIGFICPVAYYKRCGKTPAELYADAVQRQPRVRALTQKATREGRVRTTNDWSFVAERLIGSNWILIGESAGFADPILAGGLTLAHDSARHAAYLILEHLRGELDRAWLDRHYDESQRGRVVQYMRFADFWYAANGQFGDLKEFSAEIAKASGLTLTPDAAFRWLSLGGFNPGDGSRPGLGGLDLGAVREVTSIFTTNSRPGWQMNRFNVFRLDLNGAESDVTPVLDVGRIRKCTCYRRDGKTLTLAGVFAHVVDVLREHQEFRDVVEGLRRKVRNYQSFGIHDAFAALESLILDGWVTGKLKKSKEVLRYDPDRGIESNIHRNTDRLPEG